MDRELPNAEREKIGRIARAHEEVRGMHDLRSRRSGTVLFLQLHLELDDDLTLLQAHQISDEVEASLTSMKRSIALAICSSAVRPTGGLASKWALASAVSARVNSASKCPLEPK